MRPSRKPLIIAVLLGATMLAIAPLARGQNPAEPTKRETAGTGAATPLVFWNRQIHVFRAYLNQQSPAERAAKAAERLATVPVNAPEWKILTTEASVGQYNGLLVSVNDVYVFSILNDDLDHDSNESLQAAGDRVSAQ